MGKGGKQANGKVNYATKTITINPKSKKPIQFILKHELTHYLEQSFAEYADFANAVMDSEAFKNFVIAQGYGSTTEYNEALVAAYKAAGVENFGEQEANNEMVADFVGECLFGGNSKATQRLLECVQPEHRATFVERIKAFFANLKNKLSKNSNLTKELTALENKFIETYRATEANKNTATENGGEKYSIEYTNANTNQELAALIKKVKTGEFKANEKVFFGVVSDATAQKIQQLTGVDVSGFKMAIEARQIEHIIKDHGTNGKTDQSMANDVDIAKIEYVLNKPNYIRSAGKTQAYTYMKDGRNRTADTVLYEKVIGDKSYYAVQAVADTKAKTLYVVTAFIGEKGYKKEVTQLINANSPDATPKSGSVQTSNNSISEEDTTVKKKYMQNDEKYSVSTPEKVEDVLVKFKNGEISVEEYSEEQYNNFGWTRYNEILNRNDIKYLTEEIQKIKNGNARGYVLTQYGDYIISLGDKYNILVYTDDNIDSPHIRKVVEILCEDQLLLDSIRRDILDANSEKLQMADEYVRRIYGAKYFVEHKRQNFPSFRGYLRAEQERKFSRTDSNSTKTGIDRQGTLRQDGTNSSANNRVKYSVSTPEKVEDVLVKFKNGELTTEEAVRMLSKNDVMSPYDIAHLKPKDADILGGKANPKREGNGDKESSFYSSALGSDIITPEIKEQIEADTYIKNYGSTTNKRTLKIATNELLEGGQERVAKFKALKDSPEKASAVDVAVGLILLEGHQRAGNIDSTIEIAEILRSIGTSAGQTVQIFSIIGRFTPEMMVAYAQAELDKAYTALVNAKTQKWVNKHAESFKLTEADKEFIRRRTLQAALLEDGTRQKAIILAEVCARIQDKIPPEAGQSLRALQSNYVHMLKQAQKNTATQNSGGDVKYSFSSKGAEDLHDTSERLKPQTELEWSIFNRSFANKTNGLKNGEIKDILIITDKAQYLIRADGYMSGTIISKISIEDYNDIGEFINDYANSKILSSTDDRYGDRQGDNSNGSGSLEDGQRDSYDVELDEFLRKHSKSSGYTVKTRSDYKREVKENLKRAAQEGRKYSISTEPTDTTDYTTELDALDEQFKNGEIDRDEYIARVNERQGDGSLVSFLSIQTAIFLTDYNDKKYKQTNTHLQKLNPFGGAHNTLTVIFIIC